MTGAKRVTKAVIAVAGQSLRLRPLTDETPKCFLPIGKERLIDYSIKALRHVGIEEIGFVVGYKRDVFPKLLDGSHTYIYNPFFATTNNMASLWFAKDFVEGSDFLYLHGDLLYHPEILEMTIEGDAEITLAVEETPCDEEMMKVRTDGLEYVESSKNVPLDEAFGEWTGIAKFTQVGWQKYLPEVESLLAEGQFNVYDTEAMNRLAKKERVIRIAPFRDLPFIEIDFAEDLKVASEEVLPKLYPRG